MNSPDSTGEKESKKTIKSNPKRDEYGPIVVGLRETCERGKEALDEASPGRKIQLANFYFHSRYGILVATGEDGLPVAQFCTTRKDRRGGEKTERFFIGIGSEAITRGQASYSENVAQRKRVVNEFEATLGTSALFKKVVEQAQDNGDKTQRKIDEENYEYFPPITATTEVKREVNKNTTVVEAEKVTVDLLGKLFAIISEVIDSKLGARLDKNEILAFQFFDAINYADSDGSQIDMVIPRFGLSVSVSTKNNSKAFRSIRGAAGGIEILQNDYPGKTIEQVATKIAEEVTQIAIDMDRAQGVGIVGSECPVILSGEASGVLIHEIFGHPCEADIICQNRRNKSSSVSLKGRVGSQVSDNNNLTMIDSGSPDIDLGDGTILKNAWGAILYDDRGQVPKRTVVIDKGIEINVLSSEETFEEVVDGLKSEIAQGIKQHGLSGNVRREKFDEEPQVRMTNTFALPNPNGPKSPSEMAALIPKNKKGLYVAVCNGGWIQTDSGDFCIEAGLAFLIENGLITDKPIKDVKVVGNINKFGGEIKEIGSVETMGRFRGFCGKNSQWVPVEGGGPIIYIENAKVGGGGSSWRFDKILGEYMKQTNERNEHKRDTVYIPEVEEIAGIKNQDNLCMVSASISIKQEMSIITGSKDHSDFVRDGEDLKLVREMY